MGLKDSVYTAEQKIVAKAIGEFLGALIAMLLAFSGFNILAVRFLDLNLLESFLVFYTISHFIRLSK